MKLIRNKIFANILLPIIVVSASYFFITDFVLARIFYSYIEQEAEQNAKRFTLSISEKFLTIDPISITNQIFEEKYLGLPVKYIIAFDQHRNVIAHTFLDGNLRDKKAGYLNDVGVADAKYLKDDEMEVYNVDVPVMIGLQTIGLIRFGFDFSMITDGVSKIIYLYAGLFVSSILLVLYLSSRLSRLIINPIGNLTNVVENFSNGGKFKAIENVSNDEIGDLSSAFNEMAKNITTSRNLLIDEKRNTEKKNVELEKWQKLTIGRELKMVELKKEISELKKVKRSDKINSSN
ncbi:MAG: hypothetical protein ACD_67C00028G0001 [uncultured bacterium]|nr:MAG: hypothetical protein ACD_67C00028G0001 [uncultured bacterium]